MPGERDVTETVRNYLFDWGLMSLEHIKLGHIVTAKLRKIENRNKCCE